jgi:hypothetical protein
MDVKESQESGYFVKQRMNRYSCMYVHMKDVISSDVGLAVPGIWSKAKCLGYKLHRYHLTNHELSTNLA